MTLRLIIVVPQVITRLENASRAHFGPVGCVEAYFPGDGAGEWEGRAATSDRPISSMTSFRKRGGHSPFQRNFKGKG